ncbi:MAG: hypothetical protein SGARI_003142, partial [Bacillariaceae sp.]
MGMGSSNETTTATWNDQEGIAAETGDDTENTESAVPAAASHRSHHDEEALVHAELAPKTVEASDVLVVDEVAEKKHRRKRMCCWIALATIVLALGL